MSSHVALLIVCLLHESLGTNLRIAGLARVNTRSLGNNCTVSLTAMSADQTVSEACKTCKDSCEAGKDCKCWFWECGNVQGDIQWCSGQTRTGAVSCGML